MEVITRPDLTGSLSPVGAGEAERSWGISALRGDGGLAGVQQRGWWPGYG